MIREYILWMRTIDIFIQGMDLLNVSLIKIHIPECERITVILNFFSFTKKSPCKYVNNFFKLTLNIPLSVIF